MSNIEFEEDNVEGNSIFQSREILGQPRTPKLVSWFTKKGIIKNEKQAGYLLVTFCIVCVLITGYVLAHYVFDIRLETITGEPERKTLREIREERMNRDVHQ